MSVIFGVSYPAVKLFKKERAVIVADRTTPKLSFVTVLKVGPKFAATKSFKFKSGRPVSVLLVNILLLVFDNEDISIPLFSRSLAAIRRTRRKV